MIVQCIMGNWDLLIMLTPHYRNPAKNRLPILSTISVIQLSYSKLYVQGNILVSLSEIDVLP